MSSPTNKTQRGGERRNAGRKIELQGEKVTKHTVTLDPMTRRKLKVIGDGNMSRGIRISAGIAFDDYQRQSEEKN